MTQDNELFWAQQVRKAFFVGNQRLCVFSLPHWPDLFDSYEIAERLGYKQHSSLRKQTLTDWARIMAPYSDFVVVHDEKELEKYDKLFARVRALQLPPTKPSRGRLFFTPEGLAKVLVKTTKNAAELKKVLFERYPNVDWEPDLDEVFIKGQPCRRCGRRLDAAEDCPCTPAPKVQKAEKPEPAPETPFHPTPGTLEERKFEYHVMQTLIGQLERLKDATLRSLALSAAESALGRRLNEVRTREAIKGVFGAPKPTSSKKPTDKPRSQNNPSAVLIRGPVFTPPHDFYSLTRIGERAGGYSARQAGLAADIVAESMGYTREQIRKEPLPINQLAMRPDTTTGTKRQMVRFHTNFANRVVHELRSNPDFVPETPANAPVFTSFDTSDKPYPRLSMGPLDEQS